MVVAQINPGVNLQGENSPSENIQENDGPKDTRVLLCVDGEVNGVQARFLIDSGASQCFISETLVENNEMPRKRVKES